MAVVWQVECKRGGDLHMFYPADILIKPKLNGRYDPPDVEGLIASILKKGQLQPALVRPSRVRGAGTIRKRMRGDIVWQTG